MISATGQLLLTLRWAASVSPPSAEEGAVVWCFATNSLDANSPPRPREAGSPCVFVVIYRVSPAKLSDCICLRGALLVHTSHPLDSSFSKHTGRREMLVLLRSAAVCVACVCVVAVQWLWGENVKLQGEVSGIWARFLCWMVCGPIMKKSLTSFWTISHYFVPFSRAFFFSLVNPSGTSGVELGQSKASRCLARGHFSRSGNVHYTSLRSFSPPCRLHSFPPALWTPLWLSETFASSFPRLSSSPSWAAWQRATNL